MYKHRHHPSSSSESFRTPANKPMRSSLARAAANDVVASVSSVGSSPNSAANATPSQQQQYEISIYWDFENLQLPSSATAVDASKAIVAAVAQYGRIVDRRLYFDMTCPSGNGNNWSALDSSGFDLVNTPRRNQKETLDKKMIADILTFSWDSSARNDHTAVRPCVVLLTSDGDYAYTLNKLRDRGVMSIVMYGRNRNVADVLKASADIAMSFEQAVLRDFFHSSSSSSSSGAVSRAVVGSGDATARDDVLLICRIMSQQVTKGNADSGDWMLGTKISLAFRHALGSHHGEEMKERYRNAKEFGIRQGYLENGRHRMIAGRHGDIVTVPNDGTANNPHFYSLVDFLRVTQKGHKELGLPTSIGDSNVKSEHHAGGTRKKLFLKNIPSNVRIQDIVQYFETTYGVRVMRGHTIKAPFQSSFIFARVEMESEVDATLILQKAKSSDGIALRGRILTVDVDRSNEGYAVFSEYGYQRPSTQERKNSYAVPTKGAESDNDVAILCKVVQERLRKRSADANPDGWAEGGVIAADFRSVLMETRKRSLSNSEQIKEHFRNVKTEAIAQGLVQIGRRRINSLGRGGDIEVVSRHSGTAGYFLEQYVRLTEKGRDSVQLALDSLQNNDANAIKLTGLPETLDVKDLVAFLETTHDCPVQKVVLGPVGDLSGSAYVEFVSAHDASRILKMGSSSDGLKLCDKSLAAVSTNSAPLYEESDPSRIHEATRPNEVPATISTLDQSMDVESILETQSQKSGVTSQTTSTDYSENDPLSLFCRILYDQCFANISNENISNIELLTQWKSMGTIGSDFQNLFSGTRDEQKARFQTARERVISEGYAEMGRRDLRSPSREIILVPCFNSSGQALHGLSPESYLRLTEKGILMAEKCPKIKRFSSTSSFTPGVSSRNIYLSNLSTAMKVNEVVEYVERTYDVIIRRACVSQPNWHSRCISCHLELDTQMDFEIIINAAGKHGIIFNGRALLPRLDRHVPQWTKVDPALLYERKGMSEEPTVECELTRESVDITESPKMFDKANDKTMETEAMDLTMDEKETETLENTDLLFGDNLALLYAQGAPKQAVVAMGNKNTALSFAQKDDNKGENTSVVFGGFVDKSEIEMAIGTTSKDLNGTVQAPTDSPVISADLVIENSFEHTCNVEEQGKQSHEKYGSFMDSPGLGADIGVETNRTLTTNVKNKGMCYKVEAPMETLDLLWS